MEHTALPRHPSIASPARWLILPALVGLGACGSEAMSLGSNEVAVQETECLAGEITRNIFASNQADIDRLRGCTELPVSLRVVTPTDAPGSISLEPLAQLRRVRGQLQLSGPITSLAGLESLEQVGVLHLRDTQISDLTPLSNLTRVETPTDWRSSDIVITNCDQLTNLWGLENLTAWGSLEISFSEGLVSLEGLTAPEQLDRVILHETPQLADIGALRPVRGVDYFSMSRTGVPGFDGFFLERAGRLNLTENAALTDLDGLRRVNEVEDLLIADNDALTRIELPGLSEWDNISITNNDALLAVPNFNPESSLTTLESSLAGAPRRFQRGLFEVGDNPLVTAVEMYNLYAVEAIVVYRNATLAQVSIPNVTRLDSLWIQDNALLQAVLFNTVAPVNNLTLRNNPLMSVAAFATVKASTRDIAGNLDELEPAPATP
jgi:hypothetical protein